MFSVHTVQWDSSNYDAMSKQITPGGEPTKVECNYISPHLGKCNNICKIATH